MRASLDLGKSNQEATAMADQTQSTAELNLVAIDIAKEWNVVLIQESSGAPGAASKWRTSALITTG